jgi:long-chain acyl-CoA synthetase
MIIMSNNSHIGYKGVEATFATIPQMFQKVVSENRDIETYFVKTGDEWKGTTFKDLQTWVEGFANGLKNLGINERDHVAIIGTNCPQWCVSDFAIAHIRAVSVPVYPTEIPEKSRYVVKHSESKIAIVQDEVQLAKILPLLNDHECDLRKIIIMDDSYSGSDAITYSSVTALNDTTHDIKAISQTVQSSDLLTLIYTSGTTGVPKGVMLTHNNVCSNLLSIGELIELIEHKYNMEEKVFLSFLPVAHSFERVGGHYGCFNAGMQIYYAQSMETVIPNIQEVRPTFLTAVPRIFEKIHAKVMEGVEASTGVKKILAEWSIGVGLKAAPYFQQNKKLPFFLGLKYNLADKLVLHKFRAVLGGRVAAASSGGSALSPEVGSFFCGIGISIMEGYGLTETSPVMTIGHPEFFKYGTVGKPIPGVEVKIAEDGEILCRGHNVMKGYYKDPEATAEAIDKDGWFYSGDIGMFDEDGLLKITDRKKSLIVTSGGKNVAPQPMEVTLTSNKYVEQCLVIGDDRNFISALVVPSRENLIAWAEKNGMESMDYESLCTDQKTYDMYNSIVEESMRKFSRYESIRKITLIPQEWTVEGGELTPKLSIKRKVVTTKHEDEIEEMYNLKNAPTKSSDDSGHLGG